MSNVFQAQCQITAIIPDVAGRWHALANINFYGPSTYGFDATSVNLGDALIYQSSSPAGQTHKFIVDQIDSQSGNSIDFWFSYEDTGSTPSGLATGTGLICAVYNNDFLSTPSAFWCQADEYLTQYINTKNAEKIVLGGNKDLQGFSGFAGHYIDGLGNNDVNSYIEYDATEKSHLHRVEPKVDANYLDIRIGFQFPSDFEAIIDSGSAVTFQAKADDGSGDGVNVITLTSIVDTNGTSHAVTGKSTSASTMTEIAMTKAEIETAVGSAWDSTDAGKVVYFEFRLSGNDGDKIYLDNDNAYMYIK